MIVASKCIENFWDFLLYLSYYYYTYYSDCANTTIVVVILSYIFTCWAVSHYQRIYVIIICKLIQYTMQLPFIIWVTIFSYYCILSRTIRSVAHRRYFGSWARRIIILYTRPEHKIKLILNIFKSIVSLHNKNQRYNVFLHRKLFSPKSKSLIHFNKYIHILVFLNSYFCKKY